MADAMETRLGAHVGAEVVLDTDGPFLYIGKLEAVEGGAAVLVEVDVHDTRDSPSTREVYIHETKRYGVRANRERVEVRLDRVTSFSRLGDVVLYR